MAIQGFLDNLPAPPRGYQFSQRQHERQMRFFRKEYHRHLPKVGISLFRANIIALCTYLHWIVIEKEDLSSIFLVPPNVSIVFRQFIQALFITHSEVNLNSIGHLVTPNHAPNNMPLSRQTTAPARGEWCRELVRRA